MASIEENRRWAAATEWTDGGDNWSGGYGGPDSQWYGTLLPRLRRFVPADSVLEIACGHGRWTHFLQPLAGHLTVVDLNEECVEACRRRFAGAPNMSFFTNDGRSLDAVGDASIDLVFSFDSLVHADLDAMAGYVDELARVLRPEGVAFLHHSNLGANTLSARAGRVPMLRGALRQLGRLDASEHWRDPTVSAGEVAAMCDSVGLQCTSQELITWGDTTYPIDCISVIVRADSPRARPTRTFENLDFAAQVEYFHRLAELYD